MPKAKPKAKKTTRAKASTGGTRSARGTSPRVRRGSIPRASTTAIPEPAPARATKRAPGRATTELGIERIREKLTRKIGEGGQVLAKIRTPPQGRGRTPWALQVEFVLPSGGRAKYADVAEVLGDISDDPYVTRMIGARTLARLRVKYDGVRSATSMRREKREWTPGEISSFDVASHRAGRLIDEADESYGDGSTRKKPSRILSVSLWLSTEEARDTGEF